MVVITIELETTTENIGEKLKRSCSDCIKKQSHCIKKCREDCKGKIECTPRRGFEKGQCHMLGIEPRSSVYRTDMLTTTPHVPRRVSNSNGES